jgi:hypothetical protein
VNFVVQALDGFGRLFHFNHGLRLGVFGPSFR